MAKAKTTRKKKTSKAASKPRKKSVPDFPKVDLPALVSTALQQVDKRRGGASGASRRVSSSQAAQIREPNSSLGKSSRSRRAPQPDDGAPPRAQLVHQKESSLAAPAAALASRRGLRMSPRALVLTVAIAASCGALAASFGTDGLARLFPSDPSFVASQREDLTQKAARADTELTALKGNIETSAERAQSVKDEARDDVRPENTGDHTTSSIDEARATADPPETRTVEGWILRNVYGGAALVEGRPGLIQVMPGDSLPGVGRIESITRQDGRWVIVTSRGLIVTR